MIKKRLFLFCLISGLIFIPVNPLSVNSRADDRYPSQFNLSEDDIEWVEQTLAGMTLREKCAQMIFPFAVSHDTTEDSDDYQRLLKLAREDKVGGFIFFQGKLLNQAAITNQLQKAADVPLLICSDYERGLGMRLSDALEFPYNMAVAAANDPELTYQMGKYIAEESRALGVHINFAPLMDVNRDYRNPIINVRAYSENPQIISLHGTSFINGMNAGRLMAVAKHFPGHGATNLDSHNELSIIDITREELARIDLVPFQYAFAAGVKGVMIGHLEVPAYEPVKGLPATLSEHVVTGLLKNKLNFDGLIITDAMNMHSIAEKYSHEEAARLAVKAGNDIVLFPVDETAAIDGIYEGVINKEFSEERINCSVRKILAAKKWVGINKNHPVNYDELINTVNNVTHKRTAATIAAKSITLVKDEMSLIPVSPGDYYKTAIISISQTRSRRIKSSTFEKMLKRQSGYVQSCRLNLRSSKTDYENALRIAAKSDLIIVPAFVSVRAFSGNLQLQPEQVEFIKKLAALNKPMVMANFGNPYLLSEFPEVGTYLCSYGDVEVSQVAMANAVSGNCNISGRLPVSIPNTNYKLGSGITKIYNRLQFPLAGIDDQYDFSKPDSLMNAAVTNKVFPGGVLLVGHKGKVVYHKAYGRQTYDPASQKVVVNSLFDVASLTKIAATTSAAMILYDDGKLKLDERVSNYIPQFGINGKDDVTIRNLLLHNSGLPAFHPFYKECDNEDDVIVAIMNMRLKFRPGTKYLYSDLGMIVLQKVIEKITGTSIDKFLDDNLFNPLEMNRTMYNPSPRWWYNCLPTEHDNYWRMTTLKGKVHDETAYLMGGVAGHAGLFSTAHDLALLAQTMLNNGRYGDKQIFKSSTVKMWTQKQASQSSRALGWDTKSENGYSSAGSKFSFNSFGHTGFTGTSVWIDKEKELFVILLTNRIYPERINRKIINFRPLIHDAVAESVGY